VGLEPGERHRCEHASGGAAVDADVRRLIGLEELRVDLGYIFAGSWEFIVRPFAVIHGHDLDAHESGDGHGFKFRASRPASGKATTVQIDQDSFTIPSRDSSFGDIRIDVDACDPFIRPIQCKLLFVSLQIMLHEARHTIILLHHLRVLHIPQVVGHVSFRLRAQEARKRNRMRRHVNCSIRLDDDLLRCWPSCFLLRTRHPCTARERHSR
jgi:hypothetical protein